jgi:uncharacterized protein (DUF305 family)
MMKLVPLAVAAIALFPIGNPAFAQHAETSLPEICRAEMGHQAAPPMEHGGAPMDQAHADMMKGMDAMNADMAQGMMAEDIDVAFVCGMIPHHQGAIDMAKAELAHGDDPWVKEMAQKVIDAQTQEIADMKDWLAKQAH